MNERAMDHDELISALGNSVPTGTSLTADASDDSFWLPDDPVVMDEHTGTPVMLATGAVDLQSHTGDHAATMDRSTHHRTSDTPTASNPTFSPVPGEWVDFLSHPVPVAFTLESPAPLNPSQSQDLHGFDSSWQSTLTQHGQSWETALLTHDSTDDEPLIYHEWSSCSNQYQFKRFTEPAYSLQSLDSERFLQSFDTFAMDSVAQELPPVANLVHLRHNHVALSTHGAHSPKLLHPAFPGVSIFVSAPASNPTPANSGVPSDWSGSDPFGGAHTCCAPPVRPLSPYNYFFRFERDRLFQFELGGSALADMHPAMPMVHRIDAFEHYHWTKQNSIEFQRRVLEDQWGRDASVKRKHVKSHGRISFRDLSRHIATEWKALPSTAKDVFREISQRDYQRYALELEQSKSNSM